MAVVPAVPTVVGGVYTSSQVSQLAQVETFLLGNGAGSASAVRPIAVLTQTASQAITMSTGSNISFNTHVVDSVNGHSDSTNNSRYTAVYPGWYEVSGFLSMTAATSRGALLRVNGSNILPGTAVGTPDTANSWFVAFPMTLVYLNVGDYIEMNANYSAGSSTTIVGSPHQQPTMTVLFASN